MDLMYRLVQNVLDTQYTNLSPETILAAKRTVMDTLGVAIAGSQAPGCKAVADLVKDWGGKIECTILVYGDQVPMPNAVLANCTMARAWDFDDSHLGGGSHASASIVPASLAVAEHCSKPISGRDFILAVTLGVDLQCRLRRSLTPPRVWPSETFAPFGVVAAAGKLMGFDRETMLHGMGIAYSQSSCTNQANVDGALTVRLQQGFGAKAGILSALLAQKGLTGARNVLQGVYGFFPMYAKNEYDPSLITEELGKRFEIANLSIKPHPGCFFTHNPVYGTLELLKEHRIAPQDIAEIEVRSNTKAYIVCAHSEDGDTKHRPKTPPDAQFSIPYTVAAAVVRKKVFIDDFTEEAIADEQVLEIAQKVKVRPDPELDKSTDDVGPIEVQIRTKDGHIYNKYVEFVKGHVKDPMSLQECEEKFRACARFADKALPDRNLDKVLEMIYALEQVEDVRNIPSLLTV